jgi:rhodanese-related sulfurtransferase
MMSKKPAPVIVGVGRGAAAIPGWRYIGGQNFPSDGGNADLRQIAEQAATGNVNNPIVVMGTSPYDWNGYNAALILGSLGYPNVWWYRGGEESWAAAGMKSEDLRDP